jgi:hypothetical protein
MKLREASFTAEKLIAAQSITLQSILRTIAWKKALINVERYVCKTHLFLAERPSGVWIEPVQVLILWRRPVVLGEEGIVKDAAPRCDCIKVNRLCISAAEEHVREPRLLVERREEVRRTARHRHVARRVLLVNRRDGRERHAERRGLVVWRKLCEWDGRHVLERRQPDSAGACKGGVLQRPSEKAGQPVEPLALHGACTK